jgi:hypothetical protein
MAHIQITDPQVSIAGRIIKEIGTAQITVEPTGQPVAGIIQGANGTSVSKVTTLSELFNVTIPVATGSDDDLFLQSILNSRTTGNTGGYIVCKIFDSNGNSRIVNYEIFNFIIPNSPSGSLSYSVQNMEAEAYVGYTIQFTGRRVVG